MMALPDALLEGLAQVFEVMELTGELPEAMLDALITLIPKGEGGLPADQRPITVLSAVYRLWAATRVREIIVWQESLIKRCQKGFRAGHGTLDAYWALALEIEGALPMGDGLGAVLFDFRKCFDLVPHRILLKVAE